MFKKLIMFLLLCFPLIGVAQNDEMVVGNMDEYNSAIKKAIPGTKIILKNGIWKDVDLLAYGIGKKDSPIIIKAETSGQVILSGDSKLRIAGSYVIVEGLWFKDGNPTSKAIVSFRKDSNVLAFNCRFTNSTISYYNPQDLNEESHWVDLWGKNNRVDHNNFTGKENGGTTLVVWLKGEESVDNNHIIDHNLFGERLELGKNGGETIRIGTSENSMKSSKTIVENNTFRDCDGEIEIISNKSGDNIFRNNLFISSQGSLTLRHGDNALVENNVFLGNNKPRTGGIRIINEGHIIRNNLFINIKGSELRGAIVFMNGVPNSPLNRYRQVKNVSVLNNTLINSGAVEFGAGKDSEKTLVPINSIFANNLISNTNGEKIATVYDDISGITFKNNIVDSDANVDSNLFTKSKINWVMLQSLPMPTESNESLISDFLTKDSPQTDITNSPKRAPIIGAFNLGNTQYPIALKMKTGPSWSPKIEKPTKIEKELIIKIEPGVNTLSNAIKNASKKAKIILEEGIYFVESTQKIKGFIEIIGVNGSQIKSQEKLDKPLNYFFRVEEGSALTLKNLIIDGESNEGVKYAVVSPDTEKGEKYNLFIDNVTFQNFTNKDGGSVFKAYAGTLADTISIQNSTFIDNYRGLNLSYEKSALGKYNANTIIIHNSIFKNISEFAINYIKSGISQSTIGGELQITNTVFSNVANYKEGFILKLKGIPNVSIKNSVFVDSYNIETPFSLSGSGQNIDNSLIYASGSLKVSNSATKQNIQTANPKWKDKKSFLPSENSILLENNNKIATMGLKQ
jgi:poly(beta-D-mannuronate) lyase